MSRVLQIPGDHPYVRSACPPAYRAAVSPSAVPNPALSVAWLREHRSELDIVHLHFGFEHLDADGLRRWVDELRALRLPLVYTVHDLRNPHQDGPEPHDANLDVLIPAAGSVLTLTKGAAREIRRRWGRRADVVPHPAVFDPALLASGPADRSGPPTVGIHLKDLRRNVVEPDRVVRAALAGAREVGGRLRIDLHPGALRRPELRRTRELGRRGEIDLRVHGRFDDAELATYLSQLDAYVLPNRFGTHSGWLEACRDVGTRVVAPSCGYYTEQWDDVVGYFNDERAGFDEESLSDAVREALTRAPVAPVDAGFRQRQLALVRSVHTDAYTRVRPAALREHTWGTGRVAV
ncbi:glycosyltransferase family 1 protein [Kineosporia sp. NBRC 101731]|uniref:glycosyltransferase family 1 protein n=1 Tax=Kineosporia sp. NBRC 101731 TaxID=3032199 RepID=UPI0024A4765E|nr:glycosyltransferase family 1 protein [Kineosporia sp. NBRC 101731]GLY29945.1 hypothetical protein Kisp02_33100 [Kineosporia sp. NBRC 101731]